jgi:hypothetical protein
MMDIIEKKYFSVAGQCLYNYENQSEILLVVITNHIYIYIYVFTWYWHESIKQD